MGGFTPMSLGLDDFVQGGLFSDVAVEIVQIQFRGFDYGGRVQKEALAVWMQLALLDENLKRTTDEPVENYWSAGGALEDVLISDDGYQVGVLPGGSKTAMTKGSNFEILLQSMTKPMNGGAAMPKNWLRDNQSSLKCLLGTKWHLFRQTAPKREGIDTSGRRERDQEPTIATCTKIYWAPWAPKTQASRATKTQPAAVPAAAAPHAATATAPQSAPTAAPVNGSPAPETTPASAPADGNHTLAVETVTKALADNPIFASLDELKVASFRLMSKHKADARNAAMKLISDPAWLLSSGFKVQPPDDSGNQMVMA